MNTLSVQRRIALEACHGQADDQTLRRAYRAALNTKECACGAEIENNQERCQVCERVFAPFRSRPEGRVGE